MQWYRRHNSSRPHGTMSKYCRSSQYHCILKCIAIASQLFFDFLDFLQYRKYVQEFGLPSKRLIWSTPSSWVVILSVNGRSRFNVFRELFCLSVVPNAIITLSSKPQLFSSIFCRVLLVRRASAMVIPADSVKALCDKFRLIKEHSSDGKHSSERLLPDMLLPSRFKWCSCCDLFSPQTMSRHINSNPLSDIKWLLRDRVSSCMPAVIIPLVRISIWLSFKRLPKDDPDAFNVEPGIARQLRFDNLIDDSATSA